MSRTIEEVKTTPALHLHGMAQTLQPAAASATQQRNKRV